MQTLIKQIVEEQSKIDEELNKRDEGLLFYKDFFEKYHCSSISDILKIDKCDLIISMLGSNQPCQSLETIKDTIYSNRQYFENINAEDFKDLVESIIMIDQTGTLSSVVKKLYCGVRSSKIGCLLSEENSYVEYLAKLAEEYGSTPKNFAKLINLIIGDINMCFSDTEDEQNRDFALMEAIVYIDALRDYEKECTQNQEFLEELGFVGHNKLKGKAHSRIMQNLARYNGWNLENLYNDFRRVRQYYDEINNKEAARVKSLIKSKSNYETLLKQLFQAMEQKDKEMKIPEKTLSKVPNEEIKNATLRAIYKHNLELCEGKEKEYAEVSANAATRYQLLLANYGISPSEYEVGTILHQSLSNIETILRSLINLNITEPKMLLTAIQISDLSTIKNYVSLAEKGIITKNLLVNHPNLFNIRSKEYENMMRNLATAKQYNINPHYFTTTEEILLTPHKNFSNNIATLDNYQLISSMKTGLDISFLNAVDLTVAIDTLLELGLETNLESNIELLNHRKRFNRLRILKELNIPLTSTEQVLEVLTTDKFYLPDSLIPSYIYNAVDHSLPENVTLLDTPKKKLSELTRLEEYSKTSRTYDFNGVTISKNRVVRNLELVKATGNVEERLIYSVLKDAILNDDEVSKIESAIIPTKVAQTKSKKN